MEDYKVRQTGPEVQEALDQTTINKNDIAGINGKLPEEASPENPLADKAYVDGKVSAEKTRAEGAEGALQTAINNEAQARQQADGVLDGKIAAEKTRAEGAEGALQTAINSEAQARQQADGVLDGKIGAEKTRAEGAEGALQTAINSEAQARQQADGVLDGKIGAEKTRAEGAEGALQTLIQQVSASLVNYYLKTETYSKAEVNTIVDTIKQFRYIVANALPEASADTMGIIYLIPSTNPKTQNVKDEFLTVLDDSAYKWEQIGSTTVDLSGYSTTEQMNAAIATALASYYTKTQVDTLNTTITNRILFLERGLGKYDNTRSITLQQATAGKYVNVNGQEVSASGYGISAEVQLNAGDIMLVPSAEAVPADVSLFARIVTRTYQKVINYAYTYRQDYPELPATATADYDQTLVYTAQYDETGDTPVLTGWTRAGQTYTTLPATREVTESYYEPLMKQAVAAMPSTGYYVYLCPTSMTIVVSGYTATVNGGVALVVGLGIFKNIATNFIGAPGQAVLAQAFAQLLGEIDGLKAQLDNLGDTRAVCINSEEVPKVQNYPMIIYGSGAPAAPNVPAFIGQKYLDTTNKKEYTAFSVTNSVSDWVLMN